ncbi:MAG: hypothetical protein AB1716_20685 [Planctomycetota bacterium]
MLLAQETCEERRDPGRPEAAAAPNTAEMSAAIAAVFFECPARLDTRHLWTDGRLSYFRVNWWTVRDGATQICRSAFVVVQTDRHGWRIRELTRRNAA